MDRKVQLVPLSETIARTPVRPARAKVCRPKRQFIEASGSHLTQETQALLRLRLRAAAFILLVGFGAFLVRHLVGIVLGEPLDPTLLGTHILVVVVLGWSTLSL